MATVVKNIELINDGNTLLFTIPEPYLEGTVTAKGILEGEDDFPLVVTEIGDNFITIDQIAPMGYSYSITYSIDVANVSDGTPLDRSSLNSLLEAMALQQKNIVAMDKALDKRVTKEEFNAWAKVIEKEIEDLKAAILLL